MDFNFINVILNQTNIKSRNIWHHWHHIVGMDHTFFSGEGRGAFSMNLKETAHKLFQNHLLVVPISCNSRWLLASQLGDFLRELIGLGF